MVGKEQLELVLGERVVGAGTGSVISSVIVSELGWTPDRLVGTASAG